MDSCIIVRSLREVVGMVCDAWLVHRDKVVVSQFSQDPCNSSAKPLWVSIVLQVCMIGVDGELVGR